MESNTRTSGLSQEIIQRFKDLTATVFQIEIPLPPENRYHSIFACPVSKEQATPHNPPMIISCGHVIAKDSLANLAKPQGWELILIIEDLISY